jgi:hypothetical protein
MCPEQDSNLHGLAATTPSRWHVYQFRHLGINKTKIFRSKKLAIKVKKKPNEGLFFFVTQQGLEPWTLSLKGRCSTS